MLVPQQRLSWTSVEVRPRMSNYLVQTTMDKISYTPIPHFVYPIPQSQLIWVKHRVSSYFLTCVYGHSANDRAGSTVKLWSAYKLMVVLLSLLTNHFSHFGTYSDITDEELFVIVVASSKVDMLDPISALVDVKLMQTIRMSRIRMNVIVEYAVGMKILLWSHSSKNHELSWCQLCPHFGVASDYKVGIMTFLCFHSMEHSW